MAARRERSSPVRDERECERLVRHASAETQSRSGMLFLQGHGFQYDDGLNAFLQAVTVCSPA